jgi:hypothetical protein
MKLAPMLLAFAACTRAATSPAVKVDANAPEPSEASLPEPKTSVDATAPVVDEGEPDGNDDPEDPGDGHAPEAGELVAVGTPPLALTRICDLTPFGGSLYAAHAHQPLGTDGATITRYQPEAAKPFSVAFDWNRPGEPTKGGGAGQGFLRVRALGGRLFVPDADPPYAGLALVDGAAEGYVFVSDETGAFAKARAPHFRPPASAAVLPRAYHVIDVIRWRGALYASTGSVPPKERAWHGPSPGALHRASEDGTRWTYEVDYPFPWQDGVWRLTYLVRFRDRLYAGIQDYDRRDPNDFVYFTNKEPPIRREEAHPVRVTGSGASGTLRWWVDRQTRKLYWIAWTREGIVMRVTSDGDTWSVIDLPARPTDITRYRDAIVVLTERGLYRLDERDRASPIALVDATGKKKSPFEITDFFCVAPLAVLDGKLYAGGQRGGTLYRLEPR